MVRALLETDALRSASENAPSSETPRDGLMGAYASNSILGTLTTDGRRVFAVDSMDIRPRQPGVPQDESGEMQRGSQRLSRNANRLIALEVHSPLRDAAGAVKPAWSVGGTVGTSHWFYRMDANDDGRVTQAEFLGTPEQFKELDRNADGSIDATEAQQAGDKTRSSRCMGTFSWGRRSLSTAGSTPSRSATASSTWWLCPRPTGPCCGCRGSATSTVRSTKSRSAIRSPARPPAAAA